MNNTTTELQWGDVIFKPGQRVRTTDASDYAGLDGVILEIHTGEDKETDNLTPDIHCCFDFPESEADIRKLEERFSSLYNIQMISSSDKGYPLTSIIQKMLCSHLCGLCPVCYHR